MPAVAEPDPKLEAWRSLLTAHAALVDVLGSEMKAELGLPLSWYEVLLYLNESESSTLRMHELAESLLLSRSAATRFVERMESAGLVDRRPCETDRRGTQVAMTAAGREAFATAAPFHLEGIKRHFSDLIDDGEAVLITAVMSRIAARIGDED